jgi:Zn ribbon nucleic-acid-binding protein
MIDQYASCPQCHAANAEKMSFTWWGGNIGPKILTHVKCLSCGGKYNGKTGKDNSTGIVIYMIVVGLICFGLMFAVFALAAFVSVSNHPR